MYDTITNGNHPKIMLFGTGNLTTNVSHLLARSEAANMILIGRDKERSFRLANLILLTARQLGKNICISSESVDMLNISATAEIITKHKPNLIFNGASLQSWRVITTLPKEKFEELDRAQFGPWLPMHLTLMHKLMLAVKMSGQKIPVVNAAFPDAVNAILHKIDLGPLVGIGNVSNLIPAIQLTISEMLNLPVDELQVRLITQHYFSHFVPRYGMPLNTPFNLTVTYKNKDISHSINMYSLFNEVRTRFRRLGGIDGQALTAASAIKVIEGLLLDKITFTHAPGPNGLPGGYPIKVQNRTVALDLPDSISLKEAISINEACQRLDGIDLIDKDGKIYFTTETMDIMKRLLGFECKCMKVEESQDWARELAAKYREYASR